MPIFFGKCHLVMTLMIGSSGPPPQHAEERLEDQLVGVEDHSDAPSDAAVKSGAGPIWLSGLVQYRSPQVLGGLALEQGATTT